MSDPLRIAVVVALVIGTGFFTVAEYALVTARRWRIDELARAGRRGAVSAQRLMRRPLWFISTVQLGISLLGILLGAVGEPALRRLLAPPLSAAASFALAVAAMTYLSVVLGDLAPKAIALQRAERLALLVAPAVLFLERLAHPLIWLLQVSAAAVLRPFGLRPPRQRATVRSEQDLRNILAEAEKTGVIEEAEEEMLYSVFDFAATEVSDVMVPRPHVEALSVDLTVDEALAAVLNSPYTRHPVYRKSLNHVVGILHLRDLFTAAHAGHPGSISELLRPAYVVPESKDLGALLAEFQKTNQQMAIVVDEYGITVGIVTIEDLLEEIVGEIADEYDLPDESVRWIDEQTLRVAGTFPINDFAEQVGVKLRSSTFHTLAGLAFDRLGRAPVVGDAVEVDGVRMRVLAVDGPRIRSLEVRLPKPSARAHPEAERREPDPGRPSKAA